MRQKKEDYPTRLKLLKIALELYLENGFTATTNQMITQRAKCSPGELTHFFGTKENILYQVVRMVLPSHQETLEGDGSKDIPPAIRYALEIAVELTMCEQNPIIRDLYVNAYTLPKTMEFIREHSYRKSLKLFGKDLPNWTERDFYEIEILTMGIVYGALMEECNPRYNIKQKSARVIDALLKIYEFSKERREETIKAIISMDIVGLAINAEKQMRVAIAQALK